EPFPHVVLDDFLPADSFRTVYDALPALDDPKIRWGNLDSTLPDGRPAQRSKYHLQNGLFMAPVLRQFLAELNSGAFLLILQQLTGIEPLVSDPHLQGGGVHYTRRGGSLRVHADFNRHPTYRFDRRLNLLLYMNPEWHEEWGGHLEIWTRDMNRCAERVLPVANRCVIFSTGSDSWHGHPHPLTCPEDQLRRSIALYYYTPAPRADGDDGTHTTHWRDLPGESAGS
ncbi:MAG: 2OG-Fe(II) oxygenase, partial [Deltaproteobacteria bacterium]|nr:2OG-Fe(II) oxygenase [Deltaproteobacteria bacterium]